MEAKFVKGIKEYKYILTFDLASKNTGVCLWDVNKERPVSTFRLQVKGELELASAELSDLLLKFFKKLIISQSIDLTQDVLVVKEAMPTQLRGGSSTIQTFVAIARSHAILDTTLYVNNVPTYDYVGIYPITWHNYFKKVVGLGKDDKVTKELVHDYVVKTYGLSASVSQDETDAVFMCKTFVDVKWDADLQEEIRSIKRHRKTLVAPHAIKACDEKIQALTKLKILDK